MIFANPQAVQEERGPRKPTKAGSHQHHRRQDRASTRCRFYIIRLTKKDRPFCSSKLILAFVNGLAFSKYLHKKYKICPRCAIIDERSTFNHFGPTNIFAHSFGHFLPPLLHRREMDVKKHSPLQPHNAWNHPFHISAFRPIRKGVFRSFFKHHKSNVIAINSY